MAKLRSRGVVLIVEDNVVARTHMGNVLRGKGYDVEESSDGREGILKAIQEPVDVIVLDLHIAGVDGWRFRATQLAHPGLAPIPTLIVAGRHLRDIDRERLQVAYVLEKPFEDDVLVNAVEGAMRGVGRPVRPPPPQGVLEPSVHGDLLWSRAGEVACPLHAPAPGTAKWELDGWEPIAPRAGQHGLRYQCQYCAGGASVRHRP